MNIIKLLFLRMQRFALCINISGQIEVLRMPLDREYRTRVTMAHASAEAALLDLDAEIRRLQRGTGIRSLRAWA